MNKIKITCIVLIMLFNLPVLLHAQKKLKRSESFFGFHFDFHATMNDKELGKYFDAKTLGNFLERTKPDYIQIDSKGHPGISSYPTKVGYSPNSFVGDPLAQWRDVTNKYNLPLYVHYSGLWDDKAISANPDWARITADGSKDLTKAAYFGDYSDKLMIPQLKEMIDKYGIDGVWVDGDCWSTGPDYSPKVTEGFLKSSGLAKVPLKAEDPNFQSWLDYNRLAFKQYLKHYIDVIHKHKPGFQIASNWAYSSMMPEKVDVDVDFLSGDVSGQNCVYSAAFQSRCLALQGKPWDLMSWGFVPLNFSGGVHSPKSLVQLQQEAAQVMAVGGGFQVYFQQNRDASFQNSIDVDAMADLASFCRERQPFCQNSTTIPQVALWYSGEGWKKHNGGVYGWGSNMEGINNLFLDSKLPVEILMDHHMVERMTKYPVIVIPEWDYFDESIKSKLIDYVNNGGNLFVMGAKAVKKFSPYLGVDFEGTDTTKQMNIGDPDLKGITAINTAWQKVNPKAGTTSIGHVYYQRDYRFATKYPVATVTKMGKGKIAGLYMDMTTQYNTSRHPIYNRIIQQVMEQLNPRADLKVAGSENIHIALTQKNSSKFVHLINVAGNHFDRNIFSYSEIPASNELSIDIKSDVKPKFVKLQPNGIPLKFSYKDQRVMLKVPSVAVYSLVELGY